MRSLPRSVSPVASTRSSATHKSCAHSSVNRSLQCRPTSSAIGRPASSSNAALPPRNSPSRSLYTSTSGTEANRPASSSFCFASARALASRSVTSRKFTTTARTLGSASRLTAFSSISRTAPPAVRNRNVASTSSPGRLAARELSPRRLEVVRVHEREHVRSDQLVRRKPERRARRGRRVPHAPALVKQQDAVATFLHERAEPLLALAEGVLGAAAVGHVGQAAVQAYRSAARVAHHLRSVRHPARAVAGVDAVRQLELGTGEEQLPQCAPRYASRSWAWTSSAQRNG